MELNFDEIKTYFEDENNESYAFDLDTGAQIDPHELKPHTVFGYINRDSVHTCTAAFMGDEVVDIPDADTYSVIMVEKYNLDADEWQEVPNPEYEPIEELIEHGHISEGDIIRLTDVTGSHVVISVDDGLTDPSGIYIVGFSPEDFMDAYASEVVRAVYVDEDDDDDGEDDEDDSFDAYEPKLVPASALIGYIRRYSSLAKATELVNLD